MAHADLPTAKHHLFLFIKKMELDLLFFQKLQNTGSELCLFVFHICFKTHNVMLFRIKNYSWLFILLCVGLEQKHENSLALVLVLVSPWLGENFIFLILCYVPSSEKCSSFSWGSPSSLHLILKQGWCQMDWLLIAGSWGPWRNHEWHTENWLAVLW